jgi:hypothetical protein
MQRHALLFTQGTSLKSSAEALGVKYETVRSYLKSAFLKTGTHRQAELVLKVFHAMRDPNPPAIPAAIAAQELCTAVQNRKGAPVWGTSQMGVPLPFRTLRAGGGNRPWGRVPSG